MALLALMLSPIDGAAQSPPKDGATAVQLATAAFEFRDFQRVVDVLRPWVRPMRIFDEKLKIRARSLMGVSLHLLDRKLEAKEEFGDLLLLDPKHQLDAFVVPPDVIATFEAVRKELAPVLEKILKDRGERPPPKKDPVKLRLVRVPHLATTFLPLGVPQFLLDKPGWGSAFGLVQVLGVAGNITAFFAQRSLASKEEPAYDRWVGVQFGALAVAILAYAGSVIHGWFLLDAMERDLTATEPGDR